MKIKIRPKDVTEVASPAQLKKTFLAKLEDVKKQDSSTAREQMPGMETGQGQCKVFWLEGDLRLLVPSAAFGTPQPEVCTLVLAEHSGRGRKGGGYVLKNKGGQWSEYETVDDLISAVG